MIQRLLHNPHYPSGSLVCKAVINYMTGVWALVVLWRTNALVGTAYEQVTKFADEDAIAGVLLVISAVQLAWLMAYLKPLRFGAIGYAVQLAWWVAVLVLVLLDPRGNPTGIMGASTAVILAAFAFNSGPWCASDGLAAR